MKTQDVVIKNITSTDVILYASRHGIMLQPSLAKEAIRKVDVESIIEDELKRWDTSTVWDGTGNTDPMGNPAHIWHGAKTQITHEEAVKHAPDTLHYDKQGNIHKWSKKPAHPTVYENLQNGGHVVFIKKDGMLHSYQGHDPHFGGRALVSDSGNQHYHQTVAERVVMQYLEGDVRERVLKDALSIALDLHEENGVPLFVTNPGGALNS